MIVRTKEVLYSWFFFLIIKYIIYFKHILKYGRVGSGRVWHVCNFMTQTQPDLLLKKKKFITQPTKP